MAEQLPSDATIEQVAEVFGVTDRVNELTPMARRLTKGQMVAMLGAPDAPAAARMVAAGALPAVDTIVLLASNLLGNLLGGSLAVSDVQSIEQVFGGAFSAADKAAMLTSLSRRLESAKDEATFGADWEVYACCCPCCCATAVLEPASPTVA